MTHSCSFVSSVEIERLNAPVRKSVCAGARWFFFFFAYLIVNFLQPEFVRENVTFTLTDASYHWSQSNSEERSKPAHCSRVSVTFVWKKGHESTKVWLHWRDSASSVCFSSQTSSVAALMTSPVISLISLFDDILKNSALKIPSKMFFFLLMLKSHSQHFVCYYLSSASEQMDQVSNRSGVGSDDVTDENASLVEFRWSSDEEDVRRKKNHHTDTQSYWCFWNSAFAFYLTLKVQNLSLPPCGLNPNVYSQWRKQRMYFTMICTDLLSISVWVSPCLLCQSSDPQGQCLAAPQTPVTSYKQRLEEFKKLFKELPESERLIVGELFKPRVQHWPSHHSNILPVVAVNQLPPAKLN